MTLFEATLNRISELRILMHDLSDVEEITVVSRELYSMSLEAARMLDEKKEEKNK